MCVFDLATPFARINSNYKEEKIVLFFFTLYKNKETYIHTTRRQARCARVFNIHVCCFFTVERRTRISLAQWSGGANCITISASLTDNRRVRSVLGEWSFANVYSARRGVHVVWTCAKHAHACNPSTQLTVT